MFIDINTEVEVSDYELKERLLPVVYNRLSGIESTVLEAIGVVEVEVVVPEPPSVTSPRYVVEDGWIKTPTVWTRKWSVVEPELAVFKAHKRGELAQAFDQANSHPVEYDNKLWRPGESSAATIQGEVALTARAGVPARIMDIRRNWYDVTHEYALDVAQAIGMKYRELFQQYESCLAVIEVSKTVGGVEAIDVGSVFSLTD